ncbi:juvenile hormone acid O-methyltransferase-like [Cataglyphis hispanica]|uniref:juvenile hormone acid O-methyltransferase-like n=1 Tax=Cataglyphis hispanica TaxID=1086592 RepID=UPI00217F3509|nr:juvenile hormone acid O-methyltransferase-like [Cataglyphis hispanica]
MDFNREQTMKEVNVSRLTDNWDVINEGVWPSGKCMDINCAFGYTTRYFLLPELHNKTTIIGTDSSKTMIEYARGKYKNNERIEFDVLDIQTKELPAEYIGEFDHIFSFPTVHSRNDILQEFENVFKMLKPGGKFHLSMVTSHDAFTLYGHMVNHPIFGSYFEKYTTPFSHPEREIKRALQRIGFSIHYCRPILNMKYKTDYLIPYIISGLPFVNEMSSEEQEQLKNELTSSYNKIEKRVDSVSNEPNVDESNYRDIYDLLQLSAFKTRRD